MISILSRYLAFLLIRNFLFIFAGLLAIIYLFDSLELLRRSVEKSDISLGIVLQMSAFKLPEVGQLLLPFALLFAAILTLWQLARRQELVILRAAGLSAWRFLTPLLTSAALIGVLYITVLHPFSAAMLGRYEALQSQYLGKKYGLVSISKTGLWFKEQHQNQGGETIFYARNIKLPEWRLSRVMILFFDETGYNYQRLDAPSARLIEKNWFFENAVLTKIGEAPQTVPSYTIPTEITKADIQESFSDPHTISFWALPSFINTLKNTGLETAPMQFYYQSLLSQPFFFAAMILIAAAVSLRTSRMGSNLILILMGIAAGFGIFFVSNFLQALGNSGQIPIILAAWAPSIICISVGLGILMQTEDG